MKRLLKGIVAVILCFCVLFTASCGVLLYKGGAEAVKLIYITELIQKRYLFDYDTKDLLEGAITGMVDSLNDPYSVYMDEETTKAIYADNAGVFGGIGVYVSLNEEGRIVVTPIADGPGEKAGIKADDVIYAVDDIATAGMLMDEVVSMMRGEVATEVKITVERDGDLLDFQIVRDFIDEQTVASTVLETDSRIGYIAIKKFSENTDEAFVEQLNELIDQGIQSLIIDLRFNGGGSVDAACNIAALMVPQGPIVHIVDKDGKRNTINSPGAQLEAPIVVLVNGYSASASEILAGALKDTQAATLIGTKTYGKGIVQTVYFLEDGTGVKLTEAKYLTPNDNDIHKSGIEPDLYVVQGADEDSQLLAAVVYIQERLK